MAVVKIPFRSTGNDMVDKNFSAIQTAISSSDISVYIRSSSDEPKSNPSGGVLFVSGGALKYKGSNGTVTTIAPA